MNFIKLNIQFYQINRTEENLTNACEVWKSYNESYRRSGPEMEFKEFEPRLKSAKTHIKLSAGLNLETFDKILSETNHI